MINELSNGELPVLHLSGVAVAVDDRVRALDLGADGFLLKPATPAELVATLAAILRNRRGGRGSPATELPRELRPSTHDEGRVRHLAASA